MNLKTEPTVLKNILAINLNINIWSARRKLNPEDFTHSELPPEHLASLGSKKICNPKELRIFGTLKARAVKLLDKSGVRFLGGWAVADKVAPDIVKELENIATDFQIAKDNFLKNYDQSVQNWITENPGWEQIITSSVVGVDYVASRLAFNWQVFKVVNPTGRKKDVLETGLQHEVTNLGNTLFDEIAKAAREASNKSFEGKTEVTRKALSPLKNIRKKLNDLSFIEPKVLPVALLIDSALNKIPTKGAIRGTELLMLQGLLLLLNNTQNLINYAQEILEGRSHDSVIDCLIQIETKNKQQRKPKPVTENSTSTLQLESHGLW